MAQFFINTSIVSPERVDLAKFLEVGADDVYDPLTSSFLENVTKIDRTGSAVVQSSEGRADLMSYKLYRSTQYWWIILFFNALLSTDDLSATDTINFPSVDKIEDLIFSLKAQDASSNT